MRNLEYLDISDNKVLSLPAAALGRLPALKRLKADYNRIGALSYEILRSVTGLEELSLAYNIIREIPKGTFKVRPIFPLNFLRSTHDLMKVVQDHFDWNPELAGSSENFGSP